LEQAYKYGRCEIGNRNRSEYISDPNITYAGAIYDTGTNGAYVEVTAKVKSLGSTQSQAQMVLNTEWGSVTSKVDTSRHLIHLQADTIEEDS
jgi:hexokinase